MAEAKKSDETAKKSQKEAPKEVDVKPQATAKAGRRSPKSIKEAEQKIAKVERKKTVSEEIKEKPRVEQKPPRTRLERAGKKYREATEQIERGKTYTLAEAVDLASKASPAKFDATVELHINLAVDPKQADQNVRDIVSLPHGTGKLLKVAVLAEGDEALKAKKAGADMAGSDTLLSALDKEQIDFDVLICVPALMPRLGKYAKLLGPRGLMPNPKSGTVTTDIARAVKEAKAGRVEYRVDESGIVHLGIGKVSFGPQKLLENAQAVVSSVRAARPPSVKGTYIKSTYVASTMGPSIKAEL